MKTEKILQLSHAKQKLDATDMDLSGSVFTNINFAGTSITDANLSSIQVNDANLTGASFDDCKVDGMTINGFLVSELIAAYRASRK